MNFQRTGGGAMRIAVFCTCPEGVYSGGRYHALMIAACLARRGHEAHFITNNVPIFERDLAPVSPANPVKFTVTKDFDVAPRGRFDAVFVAPQMNSFPRYYHNAINFARMSEAALILVNYESANWFNAFAPSPRPEENWADWRMIASQGALVLCSAAESKKFARDFYTDMPPETVFDVWQPAINELALTQAERNLAEGRANYTHADGKGRLLAFSRPSDRHKGSNDLLDLLGPELSGYTVSTIIGNRRKAEDFITAMTKASEAYDIVFEPLFALNDVEKFEVIASSKAIIFPTYFEGFGYPPVEALAAATPCVAYDLPVIRENCGDAIEYAPVGDIEALRDSLISVLSTDERPNSQDAKVRFLADIDVRAEKIEQIIHNYRDHLVRCGGSAFKSGESINCSASALSDIPGPNGGRDVFFTLLSKSPVPHIGAPPERFLSADVCHGAWENNSRRNYALLRAPRGVNAVKELKAEGATLAFDGGACFRADFSQCVTSSEPVKALSTDNLIISRYFQSGVETIILGALYPEVPYDAAFLVNDGGDLTQLSLGLKDGASKKFRGCTNEFCGFTVCLPTSEVKSSQYRLLTVRRGIVNGYIDVGALPFETARKERFTYVGTKDTNQGKTVQLSERVLCDDHVKIRGWTDNVSGGRRIVFETEVKRAGLVKIDENTYRFRMPLNVYRKDVSEKFGLPQTTKTGFEFALPAPKAGATVRIGAGLVANRKPTGPGVDAQVRDQEPNTTLPHMRLQSRELGVGEFTDLLIDPAGRAAGTQFKFVLREQVYDPTQRILTVSGHANGSKELRVALLQKTTEALLQECVHPLGDIAAGDALRDDDFKPLAFQFEYECEAEDVLDLVIRCEDRGRAVIQLPVDSPDLKSLDEFKVTDFHFDKDQSSLWMRGLFSGPDIALDEMTVLRKNKVIARAVTGIHRRHNEDRHAGWSVEATIDSPVKAGERLTIHARTAFGASRHIGYAVPPDETTLGPLEDDDGALSIATGAPAKDEVAALLTEGSAPLVDGASEIVLLVAHNLDAPERPEKRLAMEQLRTSLNARGADLVCLHHSVGRVECDVPEINFADSWLDLEAERLEQSQTHDGEEAGDAQRAWSTDYSTRMLYGFEFMRQRSPVSWSKCAQQVLDEQRRLKAVLRRIKPSAVLLWHQWNTLMHSGRELSGAMNIPSAFVHEGMLPGTMTIDAKGMMAEASSVNATLTDDPQRRADLQGRASALIDRLREQKADRKVQFSFPIVDQLRQSIGPHAKMIFYAGINDWQSGVLPMDSPNAKTHSPIFRDTDDALDALIDAAERNGWYILYKAHPNLQPRTPPRHHERLLVVREAKSTDCILAADVTATILSSLSYISLIQQKPTVLLGRNTLSGAGAAYELAGRDALDETLSAALSGDNFALHLGAFEKHVAALLGDHLFPYGEPFDEAALNYDDAATAVTNLWR